MYCSILFFTLTRVHGSPPPGAAAGENDRPDELSAAQFHPVVPRYDQPAHQISLDAVAHAADTHHSQRQRDSPQHFFFLLLLTAVRRAGGGSRGRGVS